ncbi:MAG: hypothetical protein ABFE07_16270 [Armatimonadia bacterium]
MTTTTTTEAYWTERNALVDSVLALTPCDEELANPQTLRAVRYCEALDNLAAFDARNGGSPVL